MASLFLGNKGLGLRQQYSEVQNGALAGATDASTAILMQTFRNAARLCFLFNSTGYDLNLYLCHPDNDSTVVSNILFWLVFPANYNLNYDNGSVNWEFDPGTKLFVSINGGTSTSGAFRVISWG